MPRHRPKGAISGAFLAVRDLPFLDREDAARLHVDVLDDADPAFLVLELGVVAPRRHARDAQPLVVVHRAVAVIDALIGPIIVGAGRREIKFRDRGRQIPETDAVGWATVGLAQASTSADANSLFICTMIQHRSGVFEQGDQNGACRSAVSGRLPVPHW